MCGTACVYVTARTCLHARTWSDCDVTHCTEPCPAVLTHKHKRTTHTHDDYLSDSGSRSRSVIMILLSLFTGAAAMATWLRRTWTARGSASQGHGSTTAFMVPGGTSALPPRYACSAARRGSAVTRFTDAQAAQRGLVRRALREGHAQWRGRARPAQWVPLLRFM